MPQMPTEHAPIASPRGQPVPARDQSEPTKERRIMADVNLGNWPLSPHLQVYRLPMAAVTSIMSVSP